MKYKLYFNDEYKDIEGKPTGVALGKELAKVIANSPDSNGQAAKLSHIAMELYSKGDIELDKVDTELLKSWIEEKKDFIIFFKNALLEVFETKVEVQ